MFYFFFCVGLNVIEKNYFVNLFLRIINKMASSRIIFSSFSFSCYKRLRNCKLVLQNNIDDLTQLNFIMQKITCFVNQSSYTGQKHVEKHYPVPVHGNWIFSNKFSKKIHHNTYKLQNKIIFMTINLMLSTLHLERFVLCMKFFKFSNLFN